VSNARLQSAASVSVPSAAQGTPAPAAVVSPKKRRGRLFRVLRGILLAISLVVVAFAGLQAYVQGLLPPWLASPPRTDGAVRVFSVGGIRYAMEANYFLSPIGGDQDGVLLLARLPDFEMYTKETLPLYMKGKDYDRSITMLMANRKYSASNNKLAKIHYVTWMGVYNKETKNFTNSDATIRLPNKIGNNITHDIIPKVHIEGTHRPELVRRNMFGVNVLDSKEEMFVYYDDDDNVIAHVICNLIGSVPYPSCQQYFNFDRFEATLDFRRQHLESAPELRKKAIAFFTKARERAETLPPPVSSKIQRKAEP